METNGHQPAVDESIVTAESPLKSASEAADSPLKTASEATDSPLKTASEAGLVNGGSECEEEDTWEWWNVLRTLCDTPKRIGVCLEISADLVSDTW